MNANRDIRGFRYLLQPVLTRQRWQCDRLGIRLAQLHRNMARAEAQKQAAEREYQDFLVQLRNSVEQALDVYGYRRQLLVLGQKQQALQNSKRMLASIQEQKRLLMAQYLQAQRKEDAIAEHRQDQLGMYVMAAQNRQQSEDDRDWAARSVWVGMR